MNEEKKEQIACPVCLASLEADSHIICSSCGLKAHVGCGEAKIPPKSYFPTGILSRDEEKEKSEKVFTCNRCLEKQENQEEINNLKRSKSRLSHEIERLRSDHVEMNNAFEELKSEYRKEIENLDKRSRPVIAVSWVYIGIFIFMIAITAILVWRGWVKSPEVSIQFNVGEIIGGILVGVGAATAGIAYAFRRLRRGVEE